jgi:uncharacterized protein YjbI with pentapeptide repeats
MNSKINKLVSYLKRFAYYSNLETIGRKFVPIKRSGNEKQYPTGVIWIIGIWSAVYGITFQLYENSRQKIENRATIIISRHTYEILGKVQNMTQNKEPNWINPFRGFFREKNSDVIYDLKTFVAQEKLGLDGAQLNGAILDSLDFNGARMDSVKLFNSNISYSNFFRAEMRWSDLRFTNVNNANSVEADLRGTRLPWEKVSIEKLKGSKLASDTINGLAFVGHNLTGTSFENIYFNSVDFIDMNFTSSRFGNCVFYRCSFKNVVITNSRMPRTVFRDSDIKELDFTGIYRSGEDEKIPGWKFGVESNKLARDSI